MTVDLSITCVREALARGAAEERGEGEPSTRLLGTIFHEIHADLAGADPARNGPRFLLGLERNQKTWNEQLLDQCYRVSVGPRLARHQGFLHGTTDAVLSFWQAVRALVQFVAEITWVATEGASPPSWEQLQVSLEAEHPMSCILKEAGWSDAVRLTGIVDCMIRVPGKSAWCAVELKLGQANPTVALGQAALYHLVKSRLDHSPGARGESALALVRFCPAREEVLVRSEEVREAQQRLLKLIGQLAGVVKQAERVENEAVMPPAQDSSYASLSRQLVSAYREYGKSVEIVGQPIIGPRFLRFEARLGKGVRFEQLKSLSPEIGLRLGIGKDPIVSRAGGRLTIDLSRPDPQTVAFASVANQFRRSDPRHGSSRVLVGVGIDGQLRSAQLSDPINAHLLVAGTTGSGKTEWLRSAIASLLIANTPATLRLVLLDPKQTAFTDLKKSPFLLAPRGFWVPGGEFEAGDLLEELVVEMERRYALLADAQVDDLHRYLEKTGKPLPRVVVFCDEYYALVTAAGKEEKKRIESAIGLLGAKARAAGIHLVLAMQQASRKVIQGSVDTNIPCRVALMTSSAIESRMVLQADGADQLTGYGDLLYKDIGEPVRLQAPYLEPRDRATIFGGASSGGPL